jgi:hypothetical protein
MHTAEEYCMLTSMMPHAAVSIRSYALLSEVSKQRHLAMLLWPAGLPRQDFSHWLDLSTIKILETRDDIVTEIFPTLSCNRLLHRVSEVWKQNNFPPPCKRHWISST